MQPPESIWIVKGFATGRERAFVELALVLHEGFKQLGLRVPIHCTEAPPPAPLVLGPNLFPDWIDLPPGSILYNLEQLHEGSPWRNDRYLELLLSHPVWDYSERNVDTLREYGGSVQYAPIAHHSVLESWGTHAEKPFDVAFVGSLSNRRNQILNGLLMATRNWKIQLLRDQWGAQRDRILAASKILLNVHYYDAEDAGLEWVRVAPWFANGAFVLSEESTASESWVTQAPHSELVAACLEYHAAYTRRVERARIARDAFRKRPIRPVLERLLDCAEAA